MLVRDLCGFFSLPPYYVTGSLEAGVNCVDLNNRFYGAICIVCGGSSMSGNLAVLVGSRALLDRKPRKKKVNDSLLTYGDIER